MSEALERVLREKKVEPEAAAAIRAFEDFLGRVSYPITASVLAMDHWDQDYINGGPTPPRRWQGDDS